MRVFQEFFFFEKAEIFFCFLFVCFVCLWNIIINYSYLKLCITSKVNAVYIFWWWFSRSFIFYYLLKLVFRRSCKETLLLYFQDFWSIYLEIKSMSVVNVSTYDASLMFYFLRWVWVNARAIYRGIKSILEFTKWQ